MNCIHTVQIQIAQLRGESPYKLSLVPYNQVGKRKKYSPSNCFTVYKGEVLPAPRREMGKGGLHVFVSNRLSLLNPDKVFLEEPEYVILLEFKTLEDMGLTWKKTGSYKYSLGGGWYTDRNEYIVCEYNTPFADIECAHSLSYITPNEQLLAQMIDFATTTVYGRIT